MIVSDLFIDGEYWLDVRLGASSTAHYESLGYKLPRDQDARGRARVPKGSRIIVRVDDLPPGSSEVLTKVCDICGNRKEQRFVIIMQTRKHGIDRCQKCVLTVAPFEKSLAFLYPDIASQLLSPDVDAAKLYPCSNFKYRWKCSDCFHEWEATVNNRTNNRGCPACKKSRGERFISEYLNRVGINYRWDEDHVELKGIGGAPLRFDFEIRDNEGGTTHVIEYDGIQHYEVTDFSGMGYRYARRKFELTRKYDRAKNEWCRNHGIPILRIKHDVPFDEIPTKINEFLGGSVIAV